jgi:hypothetical protein
LDVNIRRECERLHDDNNGNVGMLLKVIQQHTTLSERLGLCPSKGRSLPASDLYGVNEFLGDNADLKRDTD